MTCHDHNLRLLAGNNDSTQPGSPKTNGKELSGAGQNNSGLFRKHRIESSRIHQNTLMQTYCFLTSPTRRDLPISCGRKAKLPAVPAASHPSLRLITLIRRLHLLTHAHDWKDRARSGSKADGRAQSS
eukprot:490744-Pleurochrysis_carterae.AAC.1